MARKLIDCQYFKYQDIAVIHEIVDGKRNYQVIKNPDFHYYIEKELKDKKKYTEYYKNINDLRRVDCKFKDRALSVHQETRSNIDITNGIDYKLEKIILANHNVYSADDFIETRLIIDYYNKYKDEIDDMIPINYMFFDIETHNDFHKLYYMEAKKIYNEIHFNKPYIPEIDKIYLEPFKYIMEETNMDLLKEHIISFMRKVKEEQFFDLRFYIALYNSKAMEIDRNRVVSFLKTHMTNELLEFYFDNIGFPDENRANNRIDAISFVDVTKRKLYMYLLNVPDDLEDISDKEYIKDKLLVKQDLFKFIELFSIVSYLKNIDKKDMEVCKELLDQLPYLNKMYHDIDITNEEDKQRVNELVELAKRIIPNYDNEVKIDVEYRLFDREIEMILEFFRMTKEEIQPSIIAAHNAKFDINTLKNRLDKYGYSFDEMINQFTTMDDDELSRIKSYIKIDVTTMERKKDKTKYFIPGVVLLDTLLLYAKSSSGEKNWSLESIANEELQDSKIKYDFEIYEFYLKDVKRFIKYSAVDTLLLMRLEERLKFINLFQVILAHTKTDWSHYMYRSLFITNLIKYEMTVRDDGHFVLRNNLTPLNPKDDKAEKSGSTKKPSYQGELQLHLYRNV